MKKTTLQEVISLENELIRSFGGVLSIPEACQELNDLQRSKIQAMKDQYGECFIFSLWTGDILTEYTGQLIHNCTGSWIVPKKDIKIIKLAEKMRTNGYNTDIFEKLVHYIYKVSNGVVLLWS